MSDFLARTAARAVGAAPLVRPRTAAPFEERETASLEVVEEPVTAPRRPAEDVRQAGAVAGARPDVAERSPPAAPAAARLEVRTAARRAAGDETSHPAPPSAAPAAAAAGSPEAAPVVRPARGTATPEPRAGPATRDAADAARGAAVEAASTRAEIRTAAAAAVAVAPVPAAAGSAQPAAAAPPRGESGAEPPSVRVHIGRLEVRANLEAAPPAPRTRERADVRLSLSDYLHGMREGR